MAQTTAWRWPWETPEAPTPQPTPAPQTGNTPEQDAQSIVTRYWRWQAAGAQAVPDPSGAKDPKTGEPIMLAVNPDTGLPDSGFPSNQDIASAESLLTRKQVNDPEAVQAAKDQAAATLLETNARTAQILASMNKAAAPTVVTAADPGDKFIVKSDGSITPNPNYIEKPSKTADQISAESAANVAQSNASVAASNATAAHENALTANIQSPQQQLRDRLTEIAATARAQADAAVASKQALVDAGVTLSDRDTLELKAKLDAIAADAKSQHDQATAQFQHDLEQPNIEANRAISQQNADTSAASVASQDQARKDQARQADINQQSGVLERQGAQGQSFVDQLSKAGVAASSGSVHMALDPLMIALNLSRQAIQSGQVPSSAMPRPSAPQPAAALGTMAPPSAPLPATNSMQQPDYGADSINDPARGY